MQQLNPKSLPSPIPHPSTPSGVGVRVRTPIRSLSPSSSSSSPLLSTTPIEREFLPNALRRKTDTNWTPRGFSLGIDLGASRTGLALGKGFSPRPLTVLELRGQKLELRLLEIAQKEEVDEFIIGLPKSVDGKETQQSNKVRSIAGRLAVRAADRGWRVYLLDEHGTSMEALDYMIDAGVKRSARQVKIDAYSAMMVLDRYFSMLGLGAELVLPKQIELQDKIRKGSLQDVDFLAEDSYSSDLW